MEKHAKPPMIVTRNELNREGRRIFPRLAVDDSYLAEITSLRGRKEMWGLFVARNNFKNPVLKIEARYVLAFSDQDLIIAQSRSTFILSDTGKAWYRRLIASHDSFATQHRSLSKKIIELPDGGKEKVTLNDNESPLAWLRRRKGADGQPFLTQEQYEAGERLRSDYMKAHLMPHLTSDWTGVIGGKRRRRSGALSGVGIMNDGVIAAKARVFKALDSIGPELAGVLIHICCLLSGLEACEKSFGWPKRSGKVILRLGLDGLARHYGMAPQIRAETYVKPYMPHWGAEDYRPHIDGESET